LEKVFEINLLYDFYGELLTERARSIFEQHYIEDYSLGEIALLEGVSRQAVHDSLRRSEAQLADYERRLGLLERFMLQKEKLSKIKELVNELEELM